MQKFSKEEALLTQACRTQEEYTKIQAEKKLERVQEKLAEAWPEIRKDNTTTA
jgi:hypothetical protein